MKNISILLAVVLIFSCKSELNNEDNTTTSGFSGLYNITYENYNKSYVWIFTEDTFYVLYPKSEDNVAYETPTHYYIEGDKLYSCGVIRVGKAESLEKCKKEKSGRVYNIISIDTILSFDKSSKDVIIQLQAEVPSGLKLKMRKPLF